MKFYQGKHSQKVIVPFLACYILIYSYFIVMIVFGSDFDSWSSADKLFGISFFAFLLLLHLFCLAYLYFAKVFYRTIEISDEGITHITKNKIIVMKWIDVKEISINPNSFSKPWARLIYFNARGCIKFKDKVLISDKYIHSEFTDEMLDEIKTYWWRDIGNEELYNKYKRKRAKKMSKSK